MVAKKAGKQQHSDEKKAAILAGLKANGGNVAKTAKDAGVPRTTLENWKQGIGINDDVTNISHVKKEELRDLHKLIAVKALGLLGKKLAECSGAQLSTIAAISTEKMLLLEGEATSITKDATDRKAEYESLVTRIMARAKDRGESPTRDEVIALIVERKPEAKEYLM